MLSSLLGSIWSSLWGKRGDEGLPAFKHKRLAARHVGKLPAMLYYGLSGFPEPVVVRDISENGLFFWCSSRLPTRAELELVMELPPVMSTPGRRRVRLRATVIRIEKTVEGNFGIAAIVKSCTALADQPAPDGPPVLPQ